MPRGAYEQMIQREQRANRPWKIGDRVELRKSRIIVHGTIVGAGRRPQTWRIEVDGNVSKETWHAAELRPITPTPGGAE